MNKFLRESGKKVILERINQIKNHEINPKNDILTSILETSSKTFLYLRYNHY